jgi:enoyl-CoA hydratase/carnithine racemase
MPDESVKWEVRGHVAILTLNRPDVLNAFDLEMMRVHRERLSEFARDDNLWVLVYVGEGRAFSAGVDVKGASEFLEWDAKDRFDLWVTPNSLGINKPSIAAVNGYAYGGGCELALGCDIRIASADARFALSEVRLGAMPGGGGTQWLPRLLASGDACYMLLTGESVDAEEALRMRLVQRVVPNTELLGAAVDIANIICENGQTAVRLVKEAVSMGASLPIRDALMLEQICFQRARTLAGPEIEERIRKFREQRAKTSKEEDKS